MPFLKAGFNPRHRSTGIRALTRHLRSKRWFAPAELLVFGVDDYLWHGRNFLSWGDFVVSYNFVPPVHVRGGAPRCMLDDRSERTW